jgi:hypothetical protein
MCWQQCWAIGDLQDLRDGQRYGRSDGVFGMDRGAVCPSIWGLDGRDDLPRTGTLFVLLSSSTPTSIVSLSLSLSLVDYSFIIILRDIDSLLFGLFSVCWSLNASSRLASSALKLAISSTFLR